MRDGDLKIGDYTVRNENKFGGNRFSLRFANDKIRDYQIEMLGMNKCSSLLDMYFVHDGDETEISYEIGGLLQLKIFLELYEGSFAKILKISANMLKGIKNCENFLLDASSIPMESDMIFINPITNEVFFMFIPSYQRSETVRGGLLRLMTEASGIKDGTESDIYIWSMLKKGLYEANPGINDMLRLVEELERETLYSEWTKGVCPTETEVSGTPQYISSATDSNISRYFERIVDFWTLVLSKALNYNVDRKLNNKILKKEADKWKR